MTARLAGSHRFFLHRILSVFDGTVLAAPSVGLDVSNLSRTQTASSRIVIDPCLARPNLDMNHPAHIAKFRSASVVTYRSIRNLTGREKKHLLHEILQVKGLMPLLMKPRNEQSWTPEDKQELRIQLRRLSSVSPYLIVLALPGSFLMLPALAEWLDRRRNRRTRPHWSCKARSNEGPTKSILDRSFIYTPSSNTDLRKTFAKLRREQRLNRKRIAEQK